MRIWFFFFFLYRKKYFLLKCILIVCAFVNVLVYDMVLFIKMLKLLIKY